MRLQEIISGQAIRFLTVFDESTPRAPLLPLVKALEDRYHFLEVPRKIGDYNFANGVTFLHGVFRDVVIEKFQVFGQGIVCESKASSDVCDEFLDDVLDWARTQLHLDVPDRGQMARAYFSRIEVQSAVDLGKAFGQFAIIGHMTSKMLRSYGQDTKDFELTGIKFHSDANPMGEFSFERRAGVTYESNLYFSIGPLRTSDHLSLLTELETLLAPTA